MPARTKHTYTLRCNLQAELSRWCEATGDDPSDVIADLVDAFLDDLAADAERDACPAADAPPPRMTMAGRGQGWRDSDAAQRLAGLMEARAKIRAAKAAAS